jgi:hypothetical protein
MEIINICPVMIMMTTLSSCSTTLRDVVAVVPSGFWSKSSRIKMRRPKSPNSHNSNQNHSSRTTRPDMAVNVRVKLLHGGKIVFPLINDQFLHGRIENIKGSKNITVRWFRNNKLPCEVPYVEYTHIPNHLFTLREYEYDGNEEVVDSYWATDCDGKHVLVQSKKIL